MVASVTLATGTPTVVVDGSPSTVIVGTDPYGDGSDSTYTTTYGLTGTPFGYTACALANLTDTRTPSDFVTWCRVATTVGRTAATADLRIQDYGGGGLINGMIGAPVADGSIQEFTFRASVDDPGNLAYYIGALMTGDLHIEVRNSFDPGEFITVYGATVTVEFATPAAPPPLRQWPGGATSIRQHPRRGTRRPGTY
jgi:hypothetical protein